MSKKHSKQHNAKKQRPTKAEGGLWFYGRHAVVAAVNNPQREVLRVLVTDNGKELLAKELDAMPHCEVVEVSQIDQHCPEHAPHQGMVAQVRPLPSKNTNSLHGATSLMVLDQVTDPHNIGAIVRSAAAFGVDAIIVHDHNCPSETGVMAKSASGALEVVPVVRVSNLVHAMEELKEQGFWFLGMDGTAKTSLKDAPKYDKVGIVMGAEGKGLRNLTAKQCDLLVKLPIKRTIESLNVSNAAAIAMYELSA